MTGVCDRLFPDGSRIEPAGVGRRCCYAVSPRGIRLSVGGVAKLYPSPEEAADDLRALGYGPASLVEAAA